MYKSNMMYKLSGRAKLTKYPPHQKNGTIRQDTKVSWITGEIANLYCPFAATDT